MGYTKLTYEQYLDCPSMYGGASPKWAKELFEKGYKGICAVDFYDDVFGEDLEPERMPEDYRTGEYAGIAIERVEKRDSDGNIVLNKRGNVRYAARRYTITQGNMKLYDLIDRSDNFCMIAPISYAGRTRKNENARFMYALCIEIDNLEPKHGLDELIFSWERTEQPLPRPTYLVCSGTGLHMYFVFERPLPLWENIFIQLTEIKKYLTPRFWNRYVSLAYDTVQYEGITQAFRCVGSITKAATYTMAFECGPKITIEYLNKFLPPDKKLNRMYQSNCTLEQAKALYPNWYRRRIEQGEGRGHFIRHQPIYYNWKQKIIDGATVGRRYHCLENLCSLAVQCDIPPEQVEADCREVAERLERLTVSDDNHFGEYDVMCALRTYYTAAEQAYRRRIDFISKKTGIELKPNKRNGRTQAAHLKRARAVQAIDYPDGEWRGRKPKADIVRQWRQRYPDGTPTQAARDLQISRTTAYKYWSIIPTGEKPPAEPAHRLFGGM